MDGGGGHCPSWRGAGQLLGSPVAADELGSGRVVVQARLPGGGWPCWVTMETTEVVIGKWARGQGMGPHRASHPPPHVGAKCLQACLSRPGCLRNFRVSSVPDAPLCPCAWGSSRGRGNQSWLGLPK